MQSGLMILMEGTLSFGFPLALAVRELMLLNRRSPPSGRSAPPAAPPALPPSSTAPVQVPQRPRIRVLEDA
jgi:hypothetical protein